MIRSPDAQFSGRNKKKHLPAQHPPAAPAAPASAAYGTRVAVGVEAIPLSVRSDVGIERIGPGQLGMVRLRACARRRTPFVSHPIRSGRAQR